MSVFRPAVRVVDPEGCEWELYAYRIALPDRRGRDPIPFAEAEGQGDVRVAILAGALDGVLWLLGGALRLLRLVLWDVPRAGLRALGSDEWTVEAIAWQPHRTSYTWRTTGELRGHVLAQVEGQLARGEVPKVAHATYLGTSG